MHAFNLQLTENFGGPAADPITHLKVIEELSRGDASSGWCAMVGSESSACINALLEPAVVREMLLESPRAVAALTVVGTGRAIETVGGFLVSGRWRFTSGCRHARWLGGLCAVYAGDTPRQRDNGAPLSRLVFVRAEEAELHDTWHTSGLQGTASDDFQLTEVFVPRERAVDLLGVPRDPGPVWRLPISLRFAMSKAAAACGMARCAMDALLPLLARSPFAGARPAREEPRVQIMLAQAEAAIEGGRAYLIRMCKKLGSLCSAVARSISLPSRAYVWRLSSRPNVRRKRFGSSRNWAARPQCSSRRSIAPCAISMWRGIIFSCRPM